MGWMNWDTYHACEVRIPKRVYPEGFYHNCLPLVGRLVYIRETASVEWVLSNAFQIFGKSKRLRKNSRDTA